MNQSNLNFQVLADAVPQIIWSAASSGEVDFFNARAIEYMGKPMDELKGFGWTEAIHPEDVELTLRTWAETVQAGIENYVEFRLLRADGEYFWYLARATPVKNKHGEVARWYGVAIDIHDRKMAEDARDSQRRQLELMTDSLPVLISYVTCSGSEFTYQYVNAAYEKWYGKPRSEIIGRTVRETLGEQSFEHALPFLQEALKGEPLEYEIQVTRADGTQRWTMASYTPDITAQGGVVGLYVAISDITERKRSESVNEILSEIGDQIRNLSDPGQIMRTVSNLVGERLDASRCFFRRLDFEKKTIIVYPDWDKGERTLAGTYSFSDFGGMENEDLIRARLQSSAPVINEDLAADPLMVGSYEDTYEPLGIRSGVSAPCLYDSNVVAAFAVYDDKKRKWRDDEVDLVKTVAGRVWPFIERAMTMSQLRNREEQLQLALASARLGAWDQDIRTGEVEWDERFREILGIQPGEALDRQKLRMRIVLEDRERIIHVVQDVLNPELPDEFTEEFRYMHPDGSTRWLVAHGLVLHEGSGPDRHPVRLVGTVQDVTARRQVEIERERLALSVESSNDFIAVASLDGKCLYVNEAGCKLVGLDDSDDPDRNLEDYLFPEDLPFVRSTVLPAVMSEGRWAGEFRFRHFKTGAQIDVLWDVFLVRDPATGEPVNFATVTRDITERKLIEKSEREAAERVRASEERFRTVVEGLPAATYTCDADGRVTLFNQAAADLWGREPELGKDMWCGSWKIYTPEGQPLPLDECPMAVTLHEGRPITGKEIVIERPNGERRHVLAHPMPLFSESGELTGALNMLMDITERKSYEETMRLSEERYRAVVEGQSEMVSRFRPDGTLLFVNGAYARYQGRAAEELIGANLWEFIPEEDRPAVRALLDQIRPESPEVRIENRLETVEGVRWTFWTNRGLDFDSDGNALEFQSAGIDITERKEAEETLLVRSRQQQAVAKLGQFALGDTRLQELFDRAVEVIADTLDVKLCKVLKLLPGGDELLLLAGVGWQDGLVGRGTVDTGLNSQAGYTLRSASPVIVEDLRTETRFSGSPLLFDHGVVSGMSCIIAGADGRPWGVLGTHSKKKRLFSADDVAFLQAVANLLGGAIQRAAAESALQEANDTLEQRVAARTSELAALTDRLRTLASQLTETEQRERRRLASLLHDHLQQLLVAAKIQLNTLGQSISDEKLNASVAKSSEFVDQAIDASRTLTTELRPPALYESGLVAGLNWLAEWMSAKYGLTVSVSADGLDQPPVDESGALLFESVRELLFNTVKYADTDRASVSLEQVMDGQICITVRDEGAGFDPAQASSDGQRGGLGLFSIRERLQLLEGRMEIESAPGMGATIRLYAPIKATPIEKARMITALAAPADGHGASSGEKSSVIRLLLADDHDIVRQGIASFLSTAPDILVIAQVNDGEKAIAAAEELHPDVVVLDVNMPNMNGIEAAKRIRERLPETRIIGLSVHADEATRQAMLSAGANAYFPKDGPAEEIIAGVRELAAKGD